MMRGRIKEIFLIVPVLSIFSYLFNLSWEAWHAVFLYQKHNLPAIQYIPMVNEVSLMDALSILVMYLLVSLFERDILWLKEWGMRSIVIFIMLGIFIAVVSEYRAVYVLKKWGYGPHMPTVFGIGLSPLIELGITGICALFVTRRLCFSCRENPE